MKDKKTRTQERIEKRNESYNDYVEQVTPKHSCLKNCAQAFVTGGIICTIGQAVMNTIQHADPKNPSINQLPRKMALQRSYQTIGGSCQWND